MNLVTDPWLPVTNSNNCLCYISLKQLFEQPDEWLDLVLRPHERVSVMRFLLCLVQASLDGPSDIDGWNEALAVIPEAGLNYVQEWQNSFGLYDKNRPFLQVGKLEPGNENSTGPSVTKLDSTLAVGENGATLFDHGASGPFRGMSTDRKLLDRKLIISLITFLNYSPSGIQSSAKLGGELIAHNSGAMDAPCGNQNMLHTFVIKNTLIKTIHANFIDKELVEEFYGANSWGRPVWELREPSSLNDERIYKNSVKTYLGRLTPLSRFCKLFQDSPYFIYCKGFQYSTKPKKKNASKRVYLDFEPETSSTVLVDSDNNYSLLKSGANVPWREVTSLITKRNKDSYGGALCLRYLGISESFDLLVVGQVRDSKNVAKILDLIESKVHIPAYMMNSDSQHAYEENIRNCERKSIVLFKAVEKYRSLLDNEWKGLLNRVYGNTTSETDRKRRNIFRKNTVNYYWTLIEKKRHLLMRYISLIGTDQDQKREEAKRLWQSAVNNAAKDSYQTLCTQESPRQVKAYVAGWYILYPSYSHQQEEI